MKYRILGIIDTLETTIGKNEVMMAKEIERLNHEHYMKFVEWIKTDCDIIVYKWMQDEVTLEEVYQYWLDNVEGK